MKIRWTVLGLAIASTLALLTTGLAPAVSQGGTGATPMPCNAPAPTKADGTRWSCVFYDPFTGKKLDRRKWGVLKTAGTGFHHGPECYVDGPDVVKVGGGVLSLSVLKAKPFQCKTTGKDSYTATATAGSVTTMDTKTFKYGLFQIRAALPRSKVPGLQSAIWMFPKKLSMSLLTSDYGEIDIGEYYTLYPDRVITALHYYPLPLVPQQTTNQNCLVNHPERYHTYQLEWTSHHIVISYDNKVCLENSNWMPIPPLAHPAPFDKPFGLILTQSLGVKGNALNRPNPPPAVMKVDWVKVWR